MSTADWTDHNESDPGISLLELFAFLGEELRYRRFVVPVALLGLALLVWWRRA